MASHDQGQPRFHGLPKMAVTAEKSHPLRVRHLGKILGTRFVSEVLLSTQASLPALHCTAPHRTKMNNDRVDVHCNSLALI